MEIKSYTGRVLPKFALNLIRLNTQDWNKMVDTKNLIIRTVDRHFMIKKGIMIIMLEISRAINKEIDTGLEQRVIWIDLTKSHLQFLWKEWAQSSSIFVPLMMKTKMLCSIKIKIIIYMMKEEEIIEMIGINFISILNKNRYWIEII